MFDTKAEAAQAGRSTAKRSQVEHLIHNQDGKIARRNSYGNDPYPPKGRSPDRCASATSMKPELTETALSSCLWAWWSITTKQAKIDRELRERFDAIYELAKWPRESSSPTRFDK